MPESYHEHPRSWFGSEVQFADVSIPRLLTGVGVLGRKNAENSVPLVLERHLLTERRCPQVVTPPVRRIWTYRMTVMEGEKEK